MSPFAPPSRHGITAPSPLMSQRSALCAISVPPLFIFMISASARSDSPTPCSDPFFGRFLSNGVRSARLFDTTLARKLLQIRFVAFPRVSTNVDRSAAFASSVVASTPSVLPSIIPLELELLAPSRFVNFQRKRFRIRDSDEWSGVRSSIPRPRNWRKDSESEHRQQIPRSIRKYTPGGMLGRPCFFA